MSLWPYARELAFLLLLSGCGGRLAGEEANDASNQRGAAPEGGEQPEYLVEPSYDTSQERCAARIWTGTCFPTVTAACLALNCPGDRCTFTYSMVSGVVCAEPGEPAWVP